MDGQLDIFGRTLKLDELGYYDSYYKTWNGLYLRKGFHESDTRMLRRYESGLIDFPRLVEEFERVHKIKIDPIKFQEWIQSLGWRVH